MVQKVRLRYLILPLILVGALAGMLIVRASSASHAFRDYLAQSFAPRPDCPVPEPFVETGVEYDCFDGRLPSGRAIQLVLGREPGSRATVWSYIGIFVPGAPALETLAARVRARGDWWGRRAGGQPRTHFL